MTIKDVLAMPEYEFLINAPELSSAGRDIMFVTFGGSYAYGTNNEDSDIDIRGVAANSKRDLLGMTSFDHLKDGKTDTTIYGFNRLIYHLLNCNPFCIEMLGCKPDAYAMVNDEGRLLLDNKDMFLSQRAASAMAAFAHQQLTRLQNCIAKDRMGQREKEEHILNACNSAMSHFHERYQELPEGSIQLYLDDTKKADFDTEIFMDITLKHYPLRDYKSMWADMNEIAKNYGKLNQRNKKKDDTHVGKHMMHLIRLYLMFCDILEKGEIITYREKDHNLLMDIRNGKYLDSKGLVIHEFYDMLHELEKRVSYAKTNTVLPNQPDMNRIEELMMSVNDHICRR